VEKINTHHRIVTIKQNKNGRNCVRGKYSDENDTHEEIKKLRSKIELQTIIYQEA
jgi:hypothetical protein